MTSKMPQELFAALSGYISRRMGLHFPRERQNDLERGLRRAAAEFGFDSAEECARWLMLSPLTKQQIEILASHLSVGETYFFRDRKLFELLETSIIPELIQKRRNRGQYVRVWCAGCATGEEPYTLAILFRRMLLDITDWNISILATDINPSFLRKASEAVYGEWSFRDAPQWLKERCFRKAAQGRFELLPEIRKLVTFSYHNLAEDHYPSLLNNTNAMDIVLCRNVLMYFSGDRQKEVAGKLYHCLVDGGRLIVSPTEVSAAYSTPFVPDQYHGVTLYRKDATRTACPPSTPVPYRKEQTMPPVAAAPKPFVMPAAAPVSPVKPRGPEVVAQKPPDRYQEALAYYERGCFSDAEEKITALLRDRSDHAPALALLARIRANAGTLAAAREICEKAVAAEKLNPGYHYLLATILQEMGFSEESASCLKRALFLDQNFVLAHFALGNHAMRQGRTKVAEKHFENARRAVQKFRPDDILPESEGVTAARMAEIIATALNEEAA